MFKFGEASSRQISFAIIERESCTLLSYFQFVRFESILWFKSRALLTQFVQTIVIYIKNYPN